MKKEKQRKGNTIIEERHRYMKSGYRN